MWLSKGIGKIGIWIVRKLQSFFLHRKSIIKRIGIKELKRHSYITGKSGIGKSELLKLLFYSLALESRDTKKYALMLLDPHGDLAEEVRNLYVSEGQNNRLIYIEPSFEYGYTPVINPFELTQKDETSISKRAQELTEAITEIVSDSGLSTQMKAILLPCITVLLRMDGATMKDLLTFMEDEKNEHLVEKGKQSPLETHREFFNHSFYKTGYQPTKHSIYTKLLFLLGHDVFNLFVNGTSTVNVEAELNKGNILIFSLPKGIIGTEVSNALGRLIVSMTKSIALSRAGTKTKRKSVFMFIDECQNYISPSIKTILQEARKYGLHLVLSNQIISDFSPDIKKAVLSNTAVKIAGKNNKDTGNAIASEIGVKSNDITSLEKYRFYLKTDAMREAQILKPHKFLLNTKNKYYLSKEEQNTQKADLLAKYYTKIDTKPSPERQQIEAEERPPTKQEQTTTNKKYKPNSKFEF